MDCKSEAASHYAGCACNEEHWQNQVARLTRERDEARERERLARLVAEQQQERAAGLSRELLAAIQARDSYRASAEARVGMRREFEELLGCGDTMGEEAFERGLARLRGLLAAESRAERLEKVLRGLLYCLNAGYPCTAEMDIARAALQEEGK